MRFMVIPAFVLAIVCCAPSRAIASADEQTTGKSGPYKIENHCLDGPLCETTAPARPASLPSLRGVSPALDPLLPDVKQLPAAPRVPAPGSISWPWDPTNNSKGNWKPKIVPEGPGNIDPSPGPDHRNDDDQAALNFNAGAAPSLDSGFGLLPAILVIAAGVVVGFAMSMVVLKYGLAKKFCSRPFGDHVKKKYFTREENSSSWLPENLSIKTFQLETAVRNKLITPTEYTNLRSNYLVSGNFGFSMLIPVVLGAVCLTVGTDSSMALAISAVVAIMTAVLTVYALDRRHEFRSRYRTLIIQNVERSGGKGSRQGEPSGADTTFSVGDMARVIGALIRLSPMQSSQSEGTPTESPSEEGGL